MLSWEDVHAATRPLRFIFFGGLLCIVDVTISETVNGVGWRFDILNDTVGAILITVGVFRLARAPVPGPYARAMAFVKVVAVVSIAQTVLKYFVFPRPSLLSVALSLLGFCQLAATMLFCLAMRWFCEAAGLAPVARSWRTTFLLFCFLYVLPLALLELMGLVTALTDKPLHVNLGPAGLLAIPVIAVPLVHLFVSTSRMRRAAERGLSGEAAPGGFPVIVPGAPDGTDLSDG